MLSVGEMLRDRSFQMKLIELVMNFVMLILIGGRQLAGDTSPKQATVYGTLIGFTMICIITIVGIAMGNPINRFIMLMVNFSAGLLFLVSGGIMIERYAEGVDMDYGRILGAGIMALLNGVIYFLDLVVTFFSNDDS